MDDGSRKEPGEMESTAVTPYTLHANIEWRATGALTCPICGGTGWEYEPEGKFCVTCWGTGRLTIVEPFSVPRRTEVTQDR